MDKKEFKPIGPFRGWVLQNFPFIEADFDAITNYQLWCKVVEYINKIAYNEELLEDSNDELIDAFNNLKTYVETYLENLDVQGYIDNKLDEMAESGQLQEIMESYVQVEGILAYNTLTNLKDADNLVEGSFTKIYGKITYNDGLGCFYKIRLKTTEDVIDEDNIISLTNYSDLVGEKMTNKDIEDIKKDIGTLSNLNTTNKNDLVSAINEIDSNTDDNTNNIGNLSELTTPVKTNLVESINSIITSNSNTNGNYIKLTDGTLICYGSSQVQTTYNSTGTKKISFPISFNEVPSAILLSMKTSNLYSSKYVVWNVNNNTTKDSFELYWRNNDTNPSSANYAPNCNWVAIGKWK